jgi:hypothetical protein
MVGGAAHLLAKPSSFSSTRRAMRTDVNRVRRECFRWRERKEPIDAALGVILRFRLIGLTAVAAMLVTFGSVAQTNNQTSPTSGATTTDTAPASGTTPAGTTTPAPAPDATTTGPTKPISPPAVLAGPLLPTQPVSPPSIVPRSILTDEVARGDTVANRPRPDYDALGVRLGGFLFFPELLTEESFNSNIFASPSNHKSDFITTIQPKLDLKSNWNNHALNLHADARIVHYLSQTSENYEDYTISGDGRLDILHDFRLYGGLGYSVRHEPRGSPNDLGAREPQQYSVASANVGVEKVFNRVGFRLDSTVDQYRYDPVRFGIGKVSQSARNYDAYGLSLRSSYEIGPLRSVYLLTTVNSRDYTHAVDLSGFDRDSRGYFIGVGTQYDIDGVIFLEGALGFRHQNYDDSRLSNLNGLAGKAKMTWNVTRLTTLTWTASRDIEETILPFSSAYFATRTDITADHELMRNVLLNARVGYERDSFQGVSRHDDYYLAGFGAKLLLNRNFSLSGGYQFRHRSSDVSNTNFDENVIYLRLSSHL